MMKHLAAYYAQARQYFKYCFCLVVLGGSMLTMRAQTIHPYGIQQIMMVTDDQLTGTPRFVGMSGAMTAVGGDPSAVKLNPAGLGIYRHSQFSVSADGTFMRSWQQQSLSRGELFSRWHLAQLSYVFAITHPERVAGVVSNNIMISYAKRAEIARRVTLNDRYDRPKDALNWIETTIDENGYRNDIDVHYAMNISNRVYWGLGMTLEWLQMRQTIDRWEYTAADKRGNQRIYQLTETAIGKSVGWGASLGVLVHPVRMLRIGLSVESPVLGMMRETDYYTEQLVYPGTNSAGVQYDSPDFNYRWQMVTPMKASAGLGLQWKNHGLLSLQYDMQYHNLVGVSHTARVALEAALSNHWMLEAGYAYSTFYSRQRASVGVNYMGNWLRVGIAYACTWYNGAVVDSVNFLQQGLYASRENKIVFSFQWNS